MAEKYLSLKAWAASQDLSRKISPDIQRQKQLEALSNLLEEAIQFLQDHSELYDDSNYEERLLFRSGQGKSGHLRSVAEDLDRRLRAFAHELPRLGGEVQGLNSIYAVLEYFEQIFHDTPRLTLHYFSEPILLQGEEVEGIRIFVAQTSEHVLHRTFYDQAGDAVEPWLSPRVVTDILRLGFQTKDQSRRYPPTKWTAGITESQLREEIRQEGGGQQKGRIEGAWYRFLAGHRLARTELELAMRKIDFPEDLGFLTVLWEARGHESANRGIRPELRDPLVPESRLTLPFDRISETNIQQRKGGRELLHPDGHVEQLSPFISPLIFDIAESSDILEKLIKKHRYLLAHVILQPVPYKLS